MSSCQKITKQLCGRPTRSFVTLKAMVRDYIANVRTRETEELDFFVHALFDIAFEHATLAKDRNGKRFAHQRRLTRTSLKLAYHGLKQKQTQLRQAKSFEDVFDIILQLTAKTPGLGELYAYDTALRISAKLGHRPSSVYLHAGTRVGAKRLGIDTKRTAVRKRELPEELQQLEAHEIESFLCIYKNQLGAVTQR